MEEEKKELTDSPQAGFSSQWQDKLGGAVDQILNRQPFSYDPNADSLYQQYKDQYVQGGKMAMMDTLGQASTLTGGYGNSYAQAAGQQAYGSYLQGLTSKIPELYQLALDRYDREGDRLYGRYNILNAQEGKDYDRYQQGLNQTQQSWENAFRLYQMGVKTPEVLGILGIPEGKPVTDGGEGGTVGKRTSRTPQNPEEPEKLEEPEELYRRSLTSMVNSGWITPQKAMEFVDYNNKHEKFRDPNYQYYYK